MTMYRITIHCETLSLDWLEPIAKHLGHIEVAIDAPEPVRHEPKPAFHPIVETIDKAKRELSAAQRKLDRDAKRKRADRERMAKLSPKVIAAVACPTCSVPVGVPCRSISPTTGIVTNFGMHGHTHIARREAYEARS